MIYNPYLRALIMCAQRNDWKSYVEQGDGVLVQARQVQRLLSSPTTLSLSLSLSALPSSYLAN